MDLTKISKCYFIGIGGIGMSALARFFNAAGKKTFGYDLTSTVLTDKLIEEGIQIEFEDDIGKIPAEILDSPEVESTLIVYTPAIPSSNNILSTFKQHGFKVLKRAEVLEQIAKGRFTIAIGGTHGKTTITAMVAYILKEAGKDILAFVGGILTDYNSNFISSGNASVMLVEADEYDRSFHRLNPDLAVITSIDHDHLDIYRNYESMTESYMQFASNIVEGGTLLVNESVAGMFENHRATVEDYSIDKPARSFAKNVRIEDGNYVFDFVSENQTIKNISMCIGGRHNVENAVVAIAIALKQQVEQDQIKEALGSFQGIKRRFEYQIRTDNLIYIDDYAHHPKEIDACISSLKELYPDKRITGVFQPHLYSRTRDFDAAFAASLDALDELFLLDIYPAREQAIEGVSSKLILDKMNLGRKKIVEEDDLVEEILQSDVEVLVTMGAGDIDKMVIPIRQALFEGSG